MLQGYVSLFDSIRPHHEVPQKDCLNWVAKMHTLAAIKKDPSLDHDFIKNQIEEILGTIGLGPDKISKRGVHCSDIFQDNTEEMINFKLSDIMQGLGLKKKMEFFKKEGYEILQSFYASSELPRHLVHVSCTGYVSPSPAQRIVSEKNSKTTLVTHSYHMGCYGAFPAIRTALGSGYDSDIVHTEFCTLHMNPLNSSKEQLVIESLFADGFIKYSAGKEKPNIPSIKVLSLYETIIPNSSHSMEWDCQDFGFGMRLQKDVPIKIARHLQQYLRELCAKANLDYNAIKHDAIFAIHPGGPKIIQQIQEGLCLDMWQVEHSKQVLLQHGNMSSATLPHVWQSVLSDTHIEGKTYIVSMAFGPGLTISGGLLQKEG